MGNKKLKKYIASFLVMSSIYAFGAFSVETLISNDLGLMSIAEAKKVSPQDKAKARQYYMQGLSNYQKGALKNAANSFMEAEKLDIDNPLYELLAADSLRYLKQYPSSIRYYNDSLEHVGKANKKYRDKVKLKAYIGLSLAYNESKQQGKAIEYAQKAIHDFPKDYRGHLALGNIYAENKESYAKAISEYNASLEIDKEQLDSYLKLAKIYNKQGNMNGIINTYKKAIDYRPLDEAMKMALAQVYISNKDPDNPKKNYYKEAIEVLKDLNNVNSTDARVHYYLSSLYLLVGDDSNAQKELGITNSLNANLGNKLAMEIRAYLKKHAGEARPADDDTSVDINAKTGETSIMINGKPLKSSIKGDVTEEITLDDEGENKENQLVKKQISDMEKNKFKEFLKNSSNEVKE